MNKDLILENCYEIESFVKEVIINCSNDNYEGSILSLIDILETIKLIENELSRTNDD